MVGRVVGADTVLADCDPGDKLAAIEREPRNKTGLPPPRAGSGGTVAAGERQAALIYLRRACGAREPGSMLLTCEFMA